MTARGTVTVLAGAPSTANSVIRTIPTGARDNPEIEGIQPLSGWVNYLIGNDRSKWRTDIPTYAGVKYRSIYPGIDLVYYVSGGSLEYDFVVGRGADPDLIGFEVQGAKHLGLTHTGDLLISTAAGSLIMKKPRAYQTTQNGVREGVAGRFRLSKSRVGFELGPYDRGRVLVIDPVVTLAYSTFLGGSGTFLGDGGKAIAVDPKGSAYVTGSASSPDFPIVNAFQSSVKSTAGNVFVTKFSADGKSLIYSTYLGGSGKFGDVGNGIAVDSSGSAYITGQTHSSDFPTKNAFQSVLKATSALNAGDAFVSKLSPDGSSLVYSTFLGGSGSAQGFDFAQGIAVDSSGSAYVTGVTFSADFPTKNALEPSLKATSGWGNAFVTKISADGRSLIYSTFLGGSTSNGYDIGNAIALDSRGSAYVTGIANSADFPTKNPFQSKCQTGDGSFVSKFSPDGTALEYSTYLCPINDPGGAIAQGIAVGSDGTAYIVGSTYASTFPVKNAFQSKLNGDQNAFVTRFSSDGSSLVYSTYLGGFFEDEGISIAVDASGSAYVAGDAGSKDFPTKNAFQTTLKSGYRNAFVSKFTSAGLLVYSTYLGGSGGCFHDGCGGDLAYGIALDSGGNAYVTGFTYSSDFPLKNPFQSSISSRNAFLTKLTFVTPTPTPTASATPTPIPAPVIFSVPATIMVGSSFDISGAHFSSGSKINFFVATSGGPVNAGPLTPAFTSASLLTVAVPTTIVLGQGFVSVQVVNTDQDFKASNLASALLQGSAAAGIPTIESVDGVGLAATSSDPDFATDNVQTVIVQGSPVRIGGMGFDAVDGVAVNVFCACRNGKVGPLFLSPGPALSSTSLAFALPLAVPTGPASLVVINKGADASFSKSSNAVSVPVGHTINVTSVSQTGATITVNGTGFSSLTVINLFNTESGTVVNLGGMGGGGLPNIPLTFVNSGQFTFTRPAAAQSGASYVQALNPPFVPFTSSGNAAGGAFVLK